MPLFMHLRRQFADIYICRVGYNADLGGVECSRLYAELQKCCPDGGINGQGLVCAKPE